jgi:prophage regulatory protein
MDPRLDGEIDDDRAAGRDGAEVLREAVRETEPLGAFDARAIRELYKAAPADPKGLRRTIRRSELRQIVPLADSTIYELERRGEFPQRFFLTARCVVWDLAEVMSWLQRRRQAGSSERGEEGADAGFSATYKATRPRLIDAVYTRFRLWLQVVLADDRATRPNRANQQGVRLCSCDGHSKNLSASVIWGLVAPPNK